MEAFRRCGENFTVIASDSVAKIDAIVLIDDLTARASGKAHVRFIHLSLNAPAVDVAAQGGPVLFGNSTFKQASTFTPVDASSKGFVSGTGAQALGAQIIVNN